MRVTLVQPAKPSFGAAAEQHWELARPFSLFYLAAALERSAHEVRILDLEQKRYREADPADVLADHPSDLFGITAVTFSRFEAIRAAQAARALYPRAFVLAGGVHFMHCAADTLEHVAAIDAVAHGEGEQTVVSLADALERGEDPGAVPGLSYRRGGRVVPSACFATYAGFDDLPFYGAFSWDEYPEYLFGSPERLPAVSVISSRGCPYRCVFCAKSGLKYRLRDPVRVVDEIVLLRERFGVDCFNFLDLTFTASPPHVRAVCRELLARAPGVRWWCESRANIPLELLALMREAGCVSLVIGVESGSPRVLERIGKNLTVDQVLAFCAECLRLGIVVNPYFMYSHPGETAEDVRMTLDFIVTLMRLGVEPGGFQPTMVFPGTELEGIARARGVLPAGFSWSDPWDDELGRRLGQLPNVPLYREGLSDAEMEGALADYRSRAAVASASREASALSARELVFKAVRAVVQGRPSASYLLSPRFYAELARRRWARRRA